MTRKIPTNAFEIYLAMGTGRSYQALAKRFAVSKQAITKLARKESWQRKLEEFEQQVRAEAREQAIDVLGEMNERHLKVVRAIQGKALETLKNQSLRTGMDAVRALEISIKQERLIRGEPSERTEASVEDVTRHEMRRWMIVVDDERAKPEETDAETGD